MQGSSKTSIRSGVKYRNKQGYFAIKDGIKINSKPIIKQGDRKPHWLKTALPRGPVFQELRDRVKRLELNTVCHESKCPNIGECWNNKTATLMVLGNVCTRACKFCSVDTGNPQGWLDPFEPENIATTVKYMELEYVVITSVDRDDLEDGGSSHIAKCVEVTKERCPKVAIEVLSPDFLGNNSHLGTLLQSGLDVFAQNIETVKRLTKEVRDPRAGYQQTLNLLSHASKEGVVTKSGFMVGFGETNDEIYQTLIDLYNHGVEIVTIGQYLRPTKYHIPVHNYISPEQFKDYEQFGKEIGIKELVSGSLIRSSYRAEQSFQRINRGNNV